MRATKLETHSNQLQRAIDYAECRFDELVYGLYGLTRDEIRLMEESLKH